MHPYPQKPDMAEPIPSDPTNQQVITQFHIPPCARVHTLLGSRETFREATTGHMCGICGFTWKDEDLVDRMTQQMRHRGPDQQGVHCEDGISLGHRRLSIIDLSELGRQPMTNEDDTIRMAFNGEIYNFQELRPELEAKGHTFRSRTDSEVIIHAYEEYGVDCLSKLQGMFAIAIWDPRDRSLLLARDRIGIKPLYYWERNGKLAFGSEIKAILEADCVPRGLNHQSLYDYLGFEFVAAPDTMFEGIRKLPAGHCLLWKDGKATVREYWDLAYEPDNSLSYGDAVEKLRELLEGAVRSHLVSDVPLGVFLSGGLDSSALVAMMRRHISGPLRTFTIGYSDKSFSEVDYAEQVAREFDTEHHVLMLDDITSDDVEKTLWHLDEPMTDLSTVPLFFACKKAREFITVCLSGEGGDEIFAGYDRFKASRLDRLYRIAPAILREKAIGPAVMQLRDRPQKKGPVNFLKRFIEGSLHPSDGQHLRWQYFLQPSLANELFTDRFRGSIAMDPFRVLRSHNAKYDARGGALNRELYLDTRFMMTDSVLMKVDRMSMAHALEIRVPLLDHVFVEFNASLPGRWKMNGLQTKRLFRSALEGILPRNIVYRGKQGYSLPVKNLLRGRLRDYMIQLLNDSPLLREHVDMACVNRLIQEHQDMAHNHNHVLWGLMNVAIWHHTFLE